MSGLYAVAEHTNLLDLDLDHIAGLHEHLRVAAEADAGGRAGADDDAELAFPVEHVWIRFRYLDRLAARDDARHALRERSGFFGRRRLHLLQVLVVVHAHR